MFCIQCGADCGNTSGKFCGSCGAPLGVSQDTNESAPPGAQSNTSYYPQHSSASFSVVRMIAAIVVVVIIIAMFPQIRSAYYIEMVKGATTDENPNQTYGEAFDKFFKSPSWTYFKGEDGSKIVEFTGESTSSNGSMNVVLQFQIYQDSNRFKWRYLEVGGVPMNDAVMLALKKEIFAG